MQITWHELNPYSSVAASVHPSCAPPGNETSPSNDAMRGGTFAAEHFGVRAYQLWRGTSVLLHTNGGGDQHDPWHFEVLAHTDYDLSCCRREPRRIYYYKVY